MPLVVARRELRSIGWTSCAAGIVSLAAGAAQPSLTHATALEAVVAVVAFGISTGAAIGSMVLGVRTGPSILYLRIFELAPAPPAGARGERPRATATRAVAAGLATALGLLLAAAVLVGVILGLTGEAADEFVKRLPDLIALVAGGWMIVVGVVALRVAVWFGRWEARRGKVLICPRLHSGMLRPVYFAAPPIEAHAPEP